MKTTFFLSLLLFSFLASLAKGQEHYIWGGQSNAPNLEPALRYILQPFNSQVMGASLGGQNIAAWVSGPIGGPYTKGTLYTSHFFAGDGSSAVESQATSRGIALTEIAGLFWWQGETGHATYTDYQERFEQLMAWLSADYGVANMKAVLVEPWSSAVDYTDTIIAQIRSTVEDNPTLFASVSSKEGRRVDQVHVGTATAHAVAGKALLKMFALTGRANPHETGGGSILNFGH